MSCFLEEGGQSVTFTFLLVFSYFSSRIVPGYTLVLRWAERDQALSHHVREETTQEWIIRFDHLQVRRSYQASFQSPLIRSIVSSLTVSQTCLVGFGKSSVSAAVGEQPSWVVLTL